MTMMVEPPTSGLQDVFRLASALRQASGFLPSHLRTEGEIVAVILAGRELGLPPMVALRSVHLIKGKVVLAADVQLGLMRRAGVRVRWLKDGTDGEAVLELTRTGDAPHVQRFTMEMAKQAGLLSNDTWRKHPAAMLRARCVSAAGKAYMPDALAGCYVPGELDEVEPAPVLSVVPALPAQTAPAAEERPQTPAPAPKALPAGPEGVPPDAPAQTVDSWDAAREMFVGKLKATTTVDEMRAWMGEVSRHQLPHSFRTVLWGMLCQHAGDLGITPDQLRQKGAR